MRLGLVEETYNLVFLLDEDTATLLLNQPIPAWFITIIASLHGRFFVLLSLVALTQFAQDRICHSQKHFRTPLTTHCLAFPPATAFT